jgi:hypothetical protein
LTNEGEKTTSLETKKTPLDGGKHGWSEMTVSEMMAAVISERGDDVRDDVREMWSPVLSRTWEGNHK